MKNIEMYKDINKALKAWSMARCIHPFSVWLQEDYVDQESPTLLEVASKFVNCVEMPCNPQEQKHWDELCAAVKREKAKPVRNCDRFATAGGAAKAYECFRMMCANVSCNGCRFSRRGIPCVLAWLYEEAKKEVSK